MHIKEYLSRQRLITDGAMGTYYEKKYNEHIGVAEWANTTHPQRIMDIHMEYLRAGARLIRTNTFASNTLIFGSMDQVRENIRAGFTIAMQAREAFMQESGVEDVYVAADIGPVYHAAMEEDGQAEEEYREIVDTFLACGARIFVFETQTDFQELPGLLDRIRGKVPDAFIMAQFAFDKSGYTRAGISIRRIIRQAAECGGLDAYGFNCGVGAAHLYQLLKDVEFSDGKYVSALPNAGYPVTLRGRTTYADNEAYFVKMGRCIAELGIDIQGGCCGTTPDYIRSLRAGLEDVTRVSKKQRHGTAGAGERGQKDKQPNAFIQKLKNGEPVYIVELDPPYKNDITKVMEGAKLLKDAGADIIDLADSPMARARMDAGALAARVEREIGIPAMPHLCCRDRNLIGLRSAVMGNYMNGIRQMLLVTGDPVERDARNRISSVFDLNSIQLMQYVHEMNVELYGEEPMVYGGALNYHGANPDAILRRMEMKLEAGCSYFMTQPIYSLEDIARIRYLKERTNAKMMCGIMPLVSYRNMMFIHNEMPGIQVPEDIRNRYTPEMTREEAQEAAVRISLKIIRALDGVADGYYFMTPFNRAGLIAEILRKM